MVVFEWWYKWTFLSYLGVFPQLSVMETKMSPSLCLVTVERNWWEKSSIKFWGDENSRTWHTCGWRWHLGLALGRTCNTNPGVGPGKLSAVYFCREPLYLRKSHWTAVSPASLAGGGDHWQDEGSRDCPGWTHHVAEGAGCPWLSLTSFLSGSQPHPDMQESCFSANNSQKALLAEKPAPEALHYSRLQMPRHYPTDSETGAKIYSALLIVAMWPNRFWNWITHLKWFTHYWSNVTH